MKDKNNIKTAKHNLTIKSRTQKREEYRVEIARLKGKNVKYKNKLAKREENGYSSFYREHAQINGVNEMIKFYEKKDNSYSDIERCKLV